MYLGFGYYADKGLLRNAFPLSADGILANRTIIKKLSINFFVI